jgi:hypothetical protein
MVRFPKELEEFIVMLWKFEGALNVVVPVVCRKIPSVLIKFPTNICKLLVLASTIMLFSTVRLP